MSEYQNPEGQGTGANAGAGDDANKIPKATGKGLNHGRRKAQDAGKNAGKKLMEHGMKHAKNGAEKGAGDAMNGAGKGMQAGGKATNGVGKAIQGAGKAAEGIPYAGAVLGPALNGLGKGVSGAGKGMDKGGKHLSHLGKKLKNHAKNQKSMSKLASFAAFVSSNAFGMIVIGFIILLILVVIGGGTLLLGDDEGSSCGGGGGSSDDDSTTSITGTEGTWTKKGTRPYNLNHAVFLAAKKLGFNDAGAAGVVGCANNEGAGDLNAKGVLNFGETDSSGDGGVGIYQFTPGAAGGGTLEMYKSWCSKHHKSPWSSVLTETEGLMAIKQYSRTKHPSSPAEGAENWYLGCEDAAGWGSHATPRIQSAEQAYKMWKGQGGSSDDAETTASSGGSSSSSACGGSGDENDSPDGTGSISEHQNGDNWKWSQLPSDIKKYAHDPRDAGMSYGSSKGWSDPGSVPGQCVNFSNSYFHAIWGISKDFVMGDGRDMANNWHSALPGSTESKTPHAGAIAGSTDPAMGGNHTWIVLHVLSNGWSIIAEQNFTPEHDSHGTHGGSGADVHENFTWDIGLREAHEPDTEYTMPPKKYHLHWSK